MEQVERAGEVTVAELERAYVSAELGSPIGNITICSDGTSLCSLWMEGRKYSGGTIPSEMIPVAAKSDPVLKATAFCLTPIRGSQA